MTYALRNTKEIIEFDRKYKKAHNPYNPNYSEAEIEDKFVLPTGLWPLSGIATPNNQTIGLKPEIIISTFRKQIILP